MKLSILVPTMPTRVDYLKRLNRLNISKTEFLNPRTWNELDDTFLIDNGFIQTDVSGIMEDYAWTMGQKIMEEKYFGYGGTYKFRYLNKINDELQASKYSSTEANKITENLLLILTRI